MNEPDTVADLWKMHIAVARAALKNMFEPADDLVGARATLENFFDQVELLAEESEDDDALRTRLAALLTGVANGLKGPPAPLHSHDWSDLPAKAEAARNRIAELEAVEGAALPAHLREFVEAVANHYSGLCMDELDHCNDCGVCLDKGEPHQPDCIVLRAAALLAAPMSMSAEVKDLHRQLAAETLRADQGWQRYESANADRNDVRARVAELEAVWFDPSKLHVNLLRSGYPRDLALHLAGATDYDSMASKLKAIKEHTSGFGCWWGMTEAQEDLAGRPIKDEHAILHFMGSGASTMVTAHEIRRMLDTIYGLSGLDTSAPVPITAACSLLDSGNAVTPMPGAYPAMFTPDVTGDGQPAGFVVTFRDIPEAITQGDDEAEAASMARDALETALDFYYEDKRPIPPPSALQAGEVGIMLPREVRARIEAHNRELA